MFRTTTDFLLADLKTEFYQPDQNMLSLDRSARQNRCVRLHSGRRQSMQWRTRTDFRRPTQLRSSHNVLFAFGAKRFADHTRSVHLPLQQRSLSARQSFAGLRRCGTGDGHCGRQSAIGERQLCSVSGWLWFVRSARWMFRGRWHHRYGVTRTSVDRNGEYGPGSRCITVLRTGRCCVPAASLSYDRERDVDDSGDDTGRCDVNVRSGCSAFDAGFDVALFAGAMVSWARLYHMLRCHHSEAVPTSGRVSNAQSTSLGAARYGFAQISGNDDVCGDLLYGSVYSVRCRSDGSGWWFGSGRFAGGAHEYVSTATMGVRDAGRRDLYIGVWCAFGVGQPKCGHAISGGWSFIGHCLC